MNFFTFFLFISMFRFVDSTSVSLCGNVTSTWANLSIAPSIVVLREKKSEEKRWKLAMEDVDCWLQKNFNISESYTLPTKGDREMVCYKIATVPIKVGQLMVVVTEGSSAENCSTSLYGPIPNILNIKMFVDGSQNASTRRMELSLRNTGGHFGVQFGLHRADSVKKIQKTVVFMMQLSKKTLEYAKLLPFWKPTIDVPPEEYHERTIREERSSLTAKHTSISWLLIVSMMPMLIFGVVVSCYIVIHPRGGLTYTDEEVDFTIQEVDSNSKVNTAHPRSLFTAPSLDLGVPTAPDMHTALDNSSRTAISSEEVHTDVTVLSEKKSTETVRIKIVDNAKSADSPKTGREE